MICEKTDHKPNLSAPYLNFDGISYLAFDIGSASGMKYSSCRIVFTGLIVDTHLFA